MTGSASQRPPALGRLRGLRRARVSATLALAAAVAAAAPLALAPERARAAVASTKIVVLPMSSGAWIRAGAAIGGQAAAEDLSLLRVERAAKPDGAERLVLHYGDKYGRPLRARPGYFHFTLDRGGTRVTIDLAQVTRTAVDRRDLGSLFAKSPLFSSVDIVMDPQDGSTHVTALARAPIEAFIQVDGDRSDERAADADASSRIAFDFRALSSAAATQAAASAEPGGGSSLEKAGASQKNVARSARR